MISSSLRSTRCLAWATAWVAGTGRCFLACGRKRTNLSPFQPITRSDRAAHAWIQHRTRNSILATDVVVAPGWSFPPKKRSIRCRVNPHNKLNTVENELRTRLGARVDPQTSTRTLRGSHSGTREKRIAIKKNASFSAHWAVAN